LQWYAYVCKRIKIYLEILRFKFYMHMFLLAQSIHAPRYSYEYMDHTEILLNPRVFYYSAVSNDEK